MPPQANNSLATPLSLAAYAAVKAAVAEGFALPMVLGVEGIPPNVWFAADLAWKSKLATQSAEFARYVAELAGAEDRLARKVCPLEDDLGTWLAFLDRYSSSPTPFAWLTELKLGLNDMSRLHRSWAKRMREDAKLERRIADLRKKQLPPLPEANRGSACASQLRVN